MAGAECTYKEGDDDGGTIDCSLRILDFRRNSSDVPGVEVAKTINVVCSDVFFFESQLRSDHFGSLTDLTELSIRFCKIRQLPPRSFVSLERLTSLTINSYNADWTSLELEPDYESLIGLEQLKFLDLSLNNVRQLPHGLFCPLNNIQTVNLSRNGIEDIENLGLSNRSKEEERCKVPVERLILSRNEISSAPPGALASLFKLAHLDLSFNNLGVLVENTFKDLGGLEVLNVSHNRLVALPPKIFSFTPHLTELQLSNNSIGTIDLMAFSNLTRLQVLNLSGNSLDENWIKPGIFDGLRTLILLDLSANHISKVESKLFSDLTGLQVLNLAHNKIHTVASNAFAGQLNLHILLLSHNQLESLHHQTLTGLSVLDSLSLDHNRLHSLHPVALKNCSNLKKMSLNNNFLTQVRPI
jgi:Leucine-rich repeat (LRR) protein